MTKKKIAFFSPYIAIWPHAVIQRQITKILSSKFTVINILCESYLPNLCTIQIGKGLTPSSTTFEKKKICINCIKISKAVDESLANDSYWLKNEQNLFSNQEVLKLRELVGKFYADYVYKEINVGRFALYEVILKFKKKSLNLSPTEENYFFEELKNCISVVDSANQVLNELKPDLVVIYSPQYGINSCFAEVAIQKKIKVYYLAGNTAWDEIHRSARIWDYEKYGIYSPVDLEYDFESIKLTILEKLKIRKHKIILKTGRSPWVYSQPSKNQSTYDYYKIPKDKRIILAAMNSYDEFFASNTRKPDPFTEVKNLVFVDQIDWIRQLISWAEGNLQVHLIIRPHPRELPNKREGVVAEFVAEWENLLIDLPTNVTVSHPTDLFSIYDLFSDIKILTTGWSSTAFEADMFGVPVVTYDHRISKLPKQLGLTGETVQKYFNNLHDILKFGNPKNTGKIGAKWFAHINYRGSIYLPGRLIDRIVLRSLNQYVIFRKILTLIPLNILRWIDLRGPISHSTKRKLIRLMSDDSDSLYEL